MSKIIKIFSFRLPGSTVTSLKQSSSEDKRMRKSMVYSK